ncbi:MAG: adenylate kinase [Thermoprotei archaeon]|nr:MAG: adenylate kinase [Thermoprotei archaeon]
MRVIVVAVPGAGKSTTLQLLKRMRPDVKIVNFGDFMFEIAKEKYGVRDRDEMRKKLSLEQYRELQLEAAKRIAEISGDVVVDTHLAIKTPKGYYPGLPTEVARLLSPDVIAVIEINPSIVLERRLKDLRLSKPVVTRVGTVRYPRAKRDVETVEEIELHQQMNRYFSVAVANETRATVKVIDLRGVVQRRPFEHAEIAARELSKLFQ